MNINAAILTAVQIFPGFHNYVTLNLEDARRQCLMQSARAWFMDSLGIVNSGSGTQKSYFSNLQCCWVCDVSFGFSWSGPWNFLDFCPISLKLFIFIRFFFIPFRGRTIATCDRQTVMWEASSSACWYLLWDVISSGDHTFVFQTFFYYFYVKEAKIPKPEVLIGPTRSCINTYNIYSRCINWVTHDKISNYLIMIIGNISDVLYIAPLNIYCLK